MFSHNNDSKNIHSIFCQSLNPPDINHLKGSEHSTLECVDNNAKQRAAVSREETKIEKEIISAINSGDIETLKPNSGQAVVIGEHYVCASFREDSESDYRVWEWHGHILLFNEESGYTQEYIYGNYIEKLMTKLLFVDEENEESERNLGVRGLIGGLSSNAGRIFCRNMNASSD